MQTTLRLDDGLYRQAKALAAQEGITLTQFIHEALTLRLKGRPTKTLNLPSFRGGPTVGQDFDLVEAIKSAEQAYEAELAHQIVRES